MGCAPSAPSLDAQAMLDKQREMMLQRQKEFEAKRQQASPGAALGGRPTPVVTAKVNLPGAKTGSAPPSPATPLKRADPPKDRDGLEETPRSRPTSKDMAKAVIAEEKAQKKTSNTLETEPDVKPEAIVSAEASSVADVETRARKYTVDQNDINARRSKNVHDFAMYAKDVTRRPSFNPRPKESPFTPEMQAMMKAGHEAMMAAEAEKKQQTMEAQEKAAAALPKFEDEEADENKGGEENDAADDEENASEKPEEAPRVTKEPESFDLDVDEVRKKEEAEKAKPETVAGLDDPNVARFLARDNVDRKSKNVHDLGQYFNRRASFVPDAPGQRRQSFLPHANGEQSRRASYLPPPSTPT